MPLITWNDDLSVGVGQLDNDHKILIEIINELFDAMHEGHGDELLETIFSRLKEYTVTHFFREETLMKSYEYPDYEAHKKHHQNLIGRLDEFIAKYTNGGGMVTTVEVSQFLQEWLLNHIKQEDFRYIPHFQENGLI